MSLAAVLLTACLLNPYRAFDLGLLGVLVIRPTNRNVRRNQSHVKDYML
jgi:hypothetical protein